MDRDRAAPRGGRGDVLARHRRDRPCPGLLHAPRRAHRPGSRRDRLRPPARGVPARPDLLDHPRTDWAFSIARRWLYDTADAVRLEALAGSAYPPLADLVAKIRREERYHLLHVDAWLRRLAGDDPVAPRAPRASAWLETLIDDGPSVFAPLPGEAAAGRRADPAGADGRPRRALDRPGGRGRHELGLARPVPSTGRDLERAAGSTTRPTSAGCGREFTSVRRLDPAASVVTSRLTEAPVGPG